MFSLLWWIFSEHEDKFTITEVWLNGTPQKESLNFSSFSWSYLHNSVSRNASLLATSLFCKASIIFLLKHLISLCLYQKLVSEKVLPILALWGNVRLSSWNSFRWHNMVDRVFCILLSEQMFHTRAFHHSSNAS